MVLTITRMDALVAREVAGWRYPPPYDLYTIGDEPLARAAFLASVADYYCLREDDTLVGFCCFGAEACVPGGDYSAPAVDIGLGIHPERTGQGRGRAYFDAITAFAERSFAPPALRLTVATFNARAIRLYANAGFREEQRFVSTFSHQPFLVMTRPVSGA